MRKCLKRLLLLSMFVLALSGAMSVNASAKVSAPSKVTIYMDKKSGNSYGGFTVTGLTESQSNKFNSSSKVKLTNTKLFKEVDAFSINYGSTCDAYFVLYYGTKTGSTTISYKIGSKTYKTKVTLKKYTNPVKSAKITNVKKSSKSQLKSFTASNSEVNNLKLSKTTSKPKLKVSAKSGWKISNVNITGHTGYFEKSYKVNKASKTITLPSMTKGSRYTIEVLFKNKSNKGEIDIIYNVK